jgi:uncharacterized protein YggE
MPMRYLLLALTFVALGATASPLPEYPFLFTSGTSRSEVPPDVVHLSFTVAARDKDAKVAVASVESTFKSVMAILLAADIRETDIDASAVDKTPRSHWDGSSKQTLPDGYDVSRKIVFTARDLTKYPQMMKSLLALTGTKEFDATFERSDRGKIEADLFALAAKDANVRAQQMAAQFGRKLGPVRAVAQIPFSSISNEFGLNYEGSSVPAPAVAMELAERNKSLDRFLAPVTITISESVNVIYELQ